MKFRIQNIKTGNYFSQPITHEAAKKFCDELNAFEVKYKIVPVELVTEKLSPVLKPMSEDVKTAIKYFDKIKFAPGTNHADFANTMFRRANEKKFEISEKEEAYLWYLIDRYRRQIDNVKILFTAQQNKVY